MTTKRLNTKIPRLFESGLPLYITLRLSTVSLITIVDEAMVTMMMVASHGEEDG